MRKLSDQLKPSLGPVKTCRVSIDEFGYLAALGEVIVQEERKVDVTRDRPRPLESREEIVPLCADLLAVPLDDDMGGDRVPFCPGLPGPPSLVPPKDVVRISLNARAPKLVRRANGVFGLPPSDVSRAGPSSSAMADSS